MPENYAEARAEKARQQEEFCKKCDEENLSGSEAMKRAGGIPFDMIKKMRVISWPKL